MEYGCVALWPCQTATRQTLTLYSIQKRGIHTIPNPSRVTPHPTMPPAAGLPSPANRRGQPLSQVNNKHLFVLMYVFTNYINHR